MKRSYLTICAGVFCALILPSLPLAADVLTIPNSENQAETSLDGVDRPARGMTMEEVTERYGDPQQVLPPVGDPTITRWVYEKFTVHFERNYVIDSVVHRK